MPEGGEARDESGAGGREDVHPDGVGEDAGTATESAPRRSAGPAEPPSARARIAHAFWHPGRGQVAVALVLGLLAMGFVLQVRERRGDQAYATARRDDLVQLVDGLDAEGRRLDSELRTLEDTRRQLEANRGSAEVARRAGRARLDELGILAGTVPAYGAGVRITINDSRRRVDAAMLLDAIGEMRDAGAEAIEANDQVRVVASSAVTGGAGQTRIDDQSVAGAIVLDVIGDPHALEEAARFRGGLATEVTAPQVGATIAIQRLDHVEVASLHASPPPQYARPAG